MSTQFPLVTMSVPLIFSDYNDVALINSILFEVNDDYDYDYD